MGSPSHEHNKTAEAEEKSENVQLKNRSLWPYVAAAAVVVIGSLIWTNPGGFLDNIGAGGKAVATVNGAEITSVQLKERVARVSASLQAKGNVIVGDEQEEQLKRQVLETLVNEELLLQAAADTGISATEDEIEEQLSDIRSRFPSSREYRNELSSNSFTEASFRENVRRQIVIQTYLAQNIGEDTIVVTDEEIQAIYDQAVASSDGEVPPLEQVYEQLRAQLRQQKLNNALGPIISEARDGAEIEILI